MAKLPFMQFYPADYLRDTRCLSMASRGAWVDILCALWNAPRRGIKALSLDGWAGELGKPSSEVSLYLLDLKSHGIAKIIYKKDEKICIISRRMVRDERVRRLALKRQQKQRKEAESRTKSRTCHADVTGIYQKSEVIDHTSEVIKEKKEKKEKIKDYEGVDSAGPTVPAVMTPAQQVWERYREAYVSRYNAEPVRNATVNGQIAQLVKRLGGAIAPEVAAFYVWHNDAFYIRNQHPIGLLLKSCEGLHTQWQTGQTVTQSQARKIDETQGRVNVFQELINERKGGIVDV